MKRRIDSDDLTTLIGLVVILRPLILFAAGGAVVMVIEAWHG